MTYGAELKFTFSADRAAAAAESFGLRADQAEPMEIHFLDTLNSGGDPKLLGLGVVLRLRGRASGADSTAKLRPADPDRLTGRWRRVDDDYRVAHDWAHRPVLTASLESTLKPKRLAAILSGDRSVKHAFTDEQRKFLRKCGPDLDTPLQGVRIAGPIAALRWTDLAPAGSGTLRAERWTWGDDNTFLEFSARVDDVADAEEWRARLVADFGDRGLEVDSASVTKTEAVLRDLLGVRVGG